MQTHELERAAQVVPGIELAGLRKTSRSASGTVEAVRDVDITIAPGETVALLGPNGAGKSTTIDLLLGLSTPDAGTVAVFGDTPHDAIAQGRIGAMLQTGGLLRLLTVRELLTMTAALYPAPLDVDEALALGDGVSPLTERERDVLAAARTHLTAAEIGAQLHLSDGTVRNYLSAAIRKLGARNRADAVDVAEEKGWLWPLSVTIV